LHLAAVRQRERRDADHRLHFSATDTNPTTAPLVIDMINPSPAGSGGAVQPRAAPPPASVGGSGTGPPERTEYGRHWSSNSVPTATDDVTIPAGGNQPVLSANAVVRDLTVQGGALLDLNGSSHRERSVAATGPVVGSGNLNRSAPVPLLVGTLSTVWAMAV
jgi:hypothetical protein